MRFTVVLVDCQLLKNGALVVSERCDDRAWLEDRFLTAETDAWVDACQETFARPDREELRAEHFVRFKARPFGEGLGRIPTPELLRLGGSGRGSSFPGERDLVRDSVSLTAGDGMGP